MQGGGHARSIGIRNRTWRGSPGAAGQGRGLKALGLFLRYLAKFRLRLFNRATIKDIPTAQFNQLVEELLSDGWKQRGSYQGFDAWIDYGRIKLRKEGVSLKMEWDNWTEGSIEGPARFIDEFARKKGLSASREWRWSEYDDAEQLARPDHQAKKQ